MPSPIYTDPGKSKDILADYLQDYRHFHLMEVKSKVRYGRNAIFSIALLTILGDLIKAILFEMPDGFYFSAAISLTFVSLGVYCTKEPLEAIIISLLLYIGFWLCAILLVDTTYIYKGIFFRVLLLYFLLRSIRFARELQQMQKDMPSHC
jgi:hypothetical protein